MQAGYIPADIQPTAVGAKSQPAPLGRARSQSVRAAWLDGRAPASRSQTSELPDPPPAFDAQPAGSALPPYEAAPLTIDHVFFLPH